MTQRKRVKLSINSSDWPLLRQTPGRAGIWGDCQFFMDEEIDECDFWVVYDDVLRPETTRCPPGNTLLITGEPPSVRRYQPRFAAQFACVLTCQRELRHSNVIYRQQALPWMVGRRYVHATRQWEQSYTKDYDELSAMLSVPKTKLLSVISSDKKITPGHAQRLAFVKALQQHFGDAIDVFGRGIRDIEDKWDAIAPYHYHVVLENGQFPDYWTEKLSDAFLAQSHPLYAGCPNIGGYFSPNALTPIDLSDFGTALKTIQTAIANEVFASSQQERQAAKRLVLDRYNVFAVIEELAQGLPYSAPARQITLRPDQRFSRGPVHTIKSVLRRVIKQGK